MIDSRKIEDLHPWMQAKAHEFVAACASAGIEVIITSTLRDYEKQNALYAQGRTAPGRIVTSARGGYSYHNFAIAFDFCPIVNGKAAWDRADLFEKCGILGEMLGLEWAGRWKSFKEPAHLQAPGINLANMRAGNPPAYLKA